ncbi:hypothetical protein PVK06_035075 [Gossypium arboreum]|uniref:photosystem I n=1 Tax=Gossypium arboreum TaxID=29729 RepID=A0ABR0NFW1_GOSAR|nr:hypothetical protein PVK06_035075 [Gossypium arboreum]
MIWGGGDLVAVGGKVALLPIPLGTADFLVHHIHAFTIHVMVLILLRGVLFARSSRLIPDKANLDFCFPCDGPGRGGTCQVSVWDHVFLGLFWMYNSISVVIFHFSWKMQSDVWGTISDQGVVTHITGGNFAQSSITINGWLRDFLWVQASQVIQYYGSSLSAYGLLFLGAHFVWAFSLMFLFSGGYDIKTPKNFHYGSYPIDAVFMPVRNVNHSIHCYGNDNEKQEILFLEIWTNGSLTLKEALHEASRNLIDLFIPFIHAEEENLHLENNQHDVTLPFFPFHDRLVKLTKKKKEIALKYIFIDQSELPPRIYNCLKKSNIHTLLDLLNNSREDLMKIEHFRIEDVV